MKLYQEEKREALNTTNRAYGSEVHRSKVSSLCFSDQGDPPQSPTSHF